MANQIAANVAHHSREEAADLVAAHLVLCSGAPPMRATHVRDVQQALVGPHRPRRHAPRALMPIELSLLFDLEQDLSRRPVAHVSLKADRWEHPGTSSRSRPAALPRWATWVPRSCGQRRPVLVQVDPDAGAPPAPAWVMTVGLALNLALLAVVLLLAAPTDRRSAGWPSAASATCWAGCRRYSRCASARWGSSPHVHRRCAGGTGRGDRRRAARHLVRAAAGDHRRRRAGGGRPEVLLPVVDEHKGAAVGLAVLAALAFGLSLYATGHVSSTVALPWVLLPPRLLGFVALAVPLALSGRLRRPGRRSRWS